MGRGDGGQFVAQPYQHFVPVEPLVERRELLYYLLLYLVRTCHKISDYSIYSTMGAIASAVAASGRCIPKIRANVTGSDAMSTGSSTTACGSPHPAISSGTCMS